MNSCESRTKLQQPLEASERTSVVAKSAEEVNKRTTTRTRTRPEEVTGRSETT